MEAPGELNTTGSGISFRIASESFLYTVLKPPEDEVRLMERQSLMRIAMFFMQRQP